MKTVEATVYRGPTGIEFARHILVTVAKLSDVADAVALEIGFTSWERYSDWCESPPLLLSVKVIGEF